MRKLLARAMFLLSFMLACGAQAAPYTTSTPIVFADGTSDIGEKYGSALSGQSFVADYTFSTTGVSSVSSAVISIALTSVSGLDITSFTLTGAGHTYTGTGSTVNGVTTYTLTASSLAAGSYTLSVSGTVTGSNGGSFGGNLNVAAVPEASSLAMMLAGLGLVAGFALRRQCKAPKGQGWRGFQPA